MIERLARIPVEVDYGSEYRYRDPIMGTNELTIVITQSGETADTIAAQREAKAKGSKTLAICNVVGAMIAREADGTIYTHAGPEIGVASTKAFTSQLAALFIFAVYLGQLRGTVSTEQSKHLLARVGQNAGQTGNRAYAWKKNWKTSPSNTAGLRTSCILAAAYTSRSLWKARSS